MLKSVVHSSQQPRHKVIFELCNCLHLKTVCFTLLNVNLLVDCSHLSQTYFTFLTYKTVDKRVYEWVEAILKEWTRRRQTLRFFDQTPSSETITNHNILALIWFNSQLHNFPVRMFFFDKSQRWTANFVINSGQKILSRKDQMFCKPHR